MTGNHCRAGADAATLEDRGRATSAMVSPQDRAGSLVLEVFEGQAGPALVLERDGDELVGHRIDVDRPLELQHPEDLAAIPEVDAAIAVLGLVDRHTEEVELGGLAGEDLLADGAPVAFVAGVGAWPEGRQLEQAH